MTGDTLLFISSQFSRLPVVAENWVKQYYKKRDIEWLLQNATPDKDRTKYRSDRHFSARADIVLLLDGGTLKWRNRHSGAEGDVRLVQGEA